ncbi:MAG: DUF4258 domain-containing protein [Bacteroidetes bacterium]|nr:DUF4258 domain-containing protein [Bacteroidota bacterium]
MKYVFSKHALEQMFNRSIQEANVIETMVNPDDIINEEENQFIYQKTFQNKVGLDNYMIRVFINGNNDPGLIKTLYLTTKLNKYLK